jgi:beta-carotene 3-hydroxylase
LELGGSPESPTGRGADVTILGITVTWLDAALFALTFIAMEGVAALEHRYAMHGFAWSWHRSHHLPPRGRFEENDRFPFVFASIAVAMFLVGTDVGALRFLVPVAAGITAYGAAYFFVHDVYIHGRLGGRHLPRVRPLERLAEAHALHHRWNSAPYGMLAPVVPGHVRRKEAGAAAADRAVDTGRLVR